MDTSAITFTLNRDGEGSLMGFSLTAVECYAECFCVSFPVAMSLNKAKLEICDGKVIFTHHGIAGEGVAANLDIYGYSEPGEYEAPISDADAEELTELLTGQGRYQSLRPHAKIQMAWGKGFVLEMR